MSKHHFQSLALTAGYFVLLYCLVTLGGAQPNSFIYFQF